MVWLSKFVWLCSLAVSISAMSTQHSARSRHARHAHEIRNVGRSVAVPDTVIRNRGSRSRCAISSPGSAPSRTPSPTSTPSVSPFTPSPASPTITSQSYTADNFQNISPFPSPSPTNPSSFPSPDRPSFSPSPDTQLTPADNSSSTPPPLPSPTSTSTSSPTQDPSVSPSPSPSPSPAPDPSPSPSPTPDSTPSPLPLPSPTPDSSPSPTPTPDPSPPPAAPAPPPSSGGGDNQGMITFYSTGLGACGWWSKDTDFIAAASHDLFDSFPGADPNNSNGNPICGKAAEIDSGGKTVTVTIVDRCEGCAYWDLDLSPSAFSALQDQSVGRTQASWHFK